MASALATLLGRTQVALSQPRSADQLVDLLESNVEELQRLSQLVSDLLFLAQAEHAAATVQVVPLELRDEVTKVADYLQPLADERGASVIVRGSCTVAADPGLVEHATTNLLANAIRHCTPGTEIGVSIEARGEEVSLDVANQGEPIDAQHLGRIFDHFYRVDDSRARDLRDSGLGLAIVRAIMQLHGGRVEARCTPAGETHFTLWFPAVRSPRTAPAHKLPG